MLGDGINPQGSTEGCIFDGSVNSVECLKNYLLPSAENLYSRAGKFLQDNAKLHTSRVTQAFFMENSTRVIKFLSRQPELNSIECTQQFVKGELKKKVFQSIEEIKAQVLKIGGTVYQESYAIV
eukprot:TRINITY_DN124430_c0_g1_i1.p2 TRINITY_DN124430_c0_g1~~TRINITY_DN124430_c0_g1_i1.p2  ORF type:complete len:124 (+),score=4.23 TRINITY_DN124430_c0_g1_i1:668-1039(+)